MKQNKDGVILIYLLTIPLSFFLLGMFLSGNMDGSKLFEEIKPVLLTLIAAYLTAHFAYKNYLSQKEQQQLEETHLLAVKSFLSITATCSRLTPFAKNKIQPKLSKNPSYLRWEIGLTSTPEIDELDIPTELISELIKHSGVNILLLDKIRVAEYNIKNYNYYIKEYETRFTKALSVTSNIKLNEKKVIDALGPGFMVQIESSAKYLAKFTADSIDSLDQLNILLKDCFIKYFKENNHPYSLPYAKLVNEEEKKFIDDVKSLINI